MADDKPSVAEKAGMSFEARCEEAKMSLQRLWILFQNLSAESLQHSQERLKKRSSAFESLGETAREHMSTLLADLDKSRTQVDEKFYTTMWEGGLRFTREVYGSDATDFALKTMETELKGN